MNVFCNEVSVKFFQLSRKTNLSRACGEEGGSAGPHRKKVGMVRRELINYESVIQFCSFIRTIH